MAPPIQGKNRTRFAMLSPMAGILGKSGPPANQNAFKRPGRHHPANGALTADDQAIREQILAGPTPASPRIAENNMATKQKCFVCGFIDTFSGMQVSQPSVGHLDNVAVSE